MSCRIGKKKIYVLSSVGFFIAFALFLNAMENRTCMGLPIIRENDLQGYIETSEFDIGKMTYRGEAVAVDYPSNSVFLFQPEKNLENVKNLWGGVEPTSPECELFILKTGNLEHLSETVRDGETLTLIMKSGSCYQKINLVITTIPVLYLDFESSAEDAQGRNLNYGKMTLWDSERPITSNAQWRLRGNSTRSLPKQPWKLNLKKGLGENNHENLLGLGSDDDWILNPMSMDDTKIKEKLAQRIWKNVAEFTETNMPMSQGEYVELLINGAYQGIYLLQRRVDTKYLGMNKKEDLLLKGKNTWEAENIEDGYEIVSSCLEENTTYEQLGKALKFKEGNTINVENFIDVSLFLQFLSGRDNYGYKNMFYALCKNNYGYELSLIPWDTDLSLGVTWGYDYERSLHAIIERQELSVVKEKIPDIEKRMAERWKELRKNLYTEESIISICEEISDSLQKSGALLRDQEKWQLLHEGDDNMENMQKFIRERLQFLDDYYAQ